MAKRKKAAADARTPAERIGRYYYIALFLAAVLFFTGYYFYCGGNGGWNAELARFDFIDVGQGDSFLAAAGGTYILIDTGTEESAPSLSAQLLKTGAESFDILLLTHPHSDHTGGTDTVFENFGVETLCLCCAFGAPEWGGIVKTAEQRGTKLIYTGEGDSITAGGFTLRTLSPYSGMSTDENENSAVVLLEYGSIRILLTADIGAETEKLLFACGREKLAADILKVGHHGSAQSSEESFLSAVSPGFAVISVGRQNDYGHPAAQTLARLEKYCGSVLRTDISGTVTFASDGKSVWQVQTGGK